MKRKKYSLKSIFDFGNFKGFTSEKVYKNRPDYISWCIDNRDNFEIEDDTITKLKSIKHNEKKSTNLNQLLILADTKV